MKVRHLEDFGPAPLDVPAVYPGVWPESSVLLVGRCVWPIVEKKDRRLEQARVHHRGCDHHAELRLPKTSLPLSYVLLRLNVTQMANRRPFLAVGSNANPTQLHRKFEDADVSTVVPMTTVTVSGLGVGFSEHVTERGGRSLYVPTTMLLAGDATRTLLVTWFDREQEAAINKTEQNYVCSIVGCRDSVMVRLGSGEVLGAVVAYQSKWGVREGADRRPIELADAHEDRLVQQRELMAMPAQPRGNPLASADEWSACPTYGEQGGIEGSGLVVRPTESTFDRHGDSVALFTAESFEELGRPDFVRLQASAPNPAAEGPGLVVRATASTAARADGLLVDQVPRNALGVEVGERVAVSPVPNRRWSVGDIIVRDPVFTFCRVQAAPLVTMERDIAVMDPLAMNVVGVEAGDAIVIEGVPGGEGDVVPTARVRVVPATDSLVEQRRALVGGGVESRYPSALDALGVWPDLSWIFLDLATRQQLNLGTSRVAAVRVRASRRDLLMKEARELLLLLVIAAIGALTLISDGRAQVAALAAVFVVVAVVVVLRLRRRVAKAGRRRSTEHRERQGM